MRTRLLGSRFRVLKDKSGFTLMEVVVAAGLLMVAAVLFGQVSFQLMGLHRTWRDDMLATQDLRHAGSVFARDAFNAATTTLVDMGPATSTISLQWIDIGDITHTVTYSVVGTSVPYTLIRDFDGWKTFAAEKVVSAKFDSLVKTPRPPGAMGG